MPTRRVVGEVTGKRRGWPRLKMEMLQRWVGWRRQEMQLQGERFFYGRLTVGQLREERVW